MYPILKTPTGRKLDKMIWEIYDLSREELLRIRDNSLPSFMTFSSLEQQAKDLRILVFQNDTEKTLRERILFCYEWYLEGGTMGQLKKILRNITRGSENEKWKILFSRDTSAFVGRGRVGSCFIGYLGNFTIMLKDPTQIQKEDVILYLENWGVPPYITYKVKEF